MFNEHQLAIITTSAESVITHKIKHYHGDSDLSESESYEDYFDPRFPRWLAVLLLIIGIFGNILSVWVFTRKNMRKNSTFIYLAFLCIVDLFVLGLGLGDLILISYFKFVIRSKSLLMCRLHTFSTYTFTHLSSFILASVSIDRAIATNLINYAKIFCKPKTAQKVIFFNILLAMLINFHSLIFLGYEESHEIHGNFSSTNPTYVCASKNGTIYDYFIDPYFYVLDLIFYVIMPFITMGICSFFIIRVIFMSNKRLGRSMSRSANLSIKRKSTCATENDEDVADNEECEDIKKIKKSTNINVRAVAYFKRASRRDKKANFRLNKTIHLTYTLISINALFFCLVCPLAIVMIMIKSKKSIQENKILINVVYLLAYSNHSFNFIFYGLSSPPYRDCVLNLLRIKKEARTIASV